MTPTYDDVIAAQADWRAAARRLLDAQNAAARAAARLEKAERQLDAYRTRYESTRDAYNATKDNTI